MVFEKIRDIIVEQLDVQEEDVTMEANLLSDLSADSLDVVELVMKIENEFDIRVSDEDLPEMNTVGDVVTYIESNLS